MIAMLRAGTKVGREDMSQRNWRLAGAGSLTFCLVTYSHYRGECGDAPGWYPAFYARSIRLSRPCRSARQSPPQAEKENLQVERKRTHGRSWKTEGRRERERGGGVAAVSAPVLRREEGLRDAMDALVFSALRRRGENGGNITLASPPSRRFLTRPHCVLLPLYLSLSSRPPPAQHQTAALAVFFFIFFIYFFCFFISCCTFRVTQTSTQQFTWSRCCTAPGLMDEWHISHLFLLPFLHINFLYFLALRLSP